MNRLLLLISFLLLQQFGHSQTGYLFVKKGFKKKKVYVEGDRISLRLKNGGITYGLITRLMNDTIFLNNGIVACRQVKDVIVRKREKESFQIDPKNFLLITGGVALVTAGLTLSNQADFKEALLAGTVIGYGPLLVGYARSKISFGRKRYRIGRKFRLQVLDFYLPRKRGF